jgi:hypothetical protein
LNNGFTPLENLRVKEDQENTGESKTQKPTDQEKKKGRKEKGDDGGGEL